MKAVVVAALATLLAAAPPLAAGAAAEAADADKRAPASQSDSAEPTAPSKQSPGAAALVRAAGNPDVARLRALLRQGAPVNDKAPSGETPLQAAAAEGLPTNVFTLLTSGAEIDALAGRGITALGWAARNGHVAVVRMLLDSGASPDHAAAPDRAPIALAAAREHYAVVALLIDRGSKVFEQPPLAGAVMTGIAQTTSIELTGLVVPRIATMIPGAPGLRDTTAAAIAGSTVPISQAILTRLGDVGRTPEFQTALLLAAIRRSRHDIASAAITAGADIDVKRGGTTPIGIAVELGDAGLVQLLMTADVDWKAAGVDRAKLEDLAGGALSERREADRLAGLGQIDRLDENGMTLLFGAAQRGNFLSVKQLLDKGASPATTVRRWPGDEGWTPLMTASAGNQIAVVELLLSRRAPVDQQNGAGRTALSFAALYGRATVVDLLLSAGADPRRADRMGQTPLALASASGDPATIARVAMALRSEAAGTPDNRAAPSGHAAGTGAPTRATSAAPAPEPR